MISNTILNDIKCEYNWCPNNEVTFHLCFPFSRRIIIKHKTSPFKLYNTTVSASKWNVKFSHCNSNLQELPLEWSHEGNTQQVSFSGQYISKASVVLITIPSYKLCRTYCGLRKHKYSSFTLSFASGLIPKGKQCHLMLAIMVMALEVYIITGKSTLFRMYFLAYFMTN